MADLSSDFPPPVEDFREQQFRNDVTRQQNLGRSHNSASLSEPWLDRRPTEPSPHATGVTDTPGGSVPNNDIAKPLQFVPYQPPRAHQAVQPHPAMVPNGDRGRTPNGYHYRPEIKERVVKMFNSGMKGRSIAEQIPVLTQGEVDSIIRKARQGGKLTVDPGREGE
jgi:hypothetical protein